MPTTSRLVAAILMAGRAWSGAQNARAYVPEGKPVGLFAPVSAAIGVGTGWFWTGRQIEKGAASGMSLGFVGAGIALFWVVVGFSGYEMVQRAMKLRYHGPVEGLEDMVGIAVDYLRDQARLDVMGLLGLGGAVIGAIVQWVARRFR
ncbi:MAG TPA: TrgA family protein [Aliiroseovarius sp.]|nr:TrgA family protein [Aliiroseovarius sp.]